MMRNINIVDIFSLFRVKILWNVWCEIPILDPSLFACPRKIVWFLTSMYYKFLEIRHWLGRCILRFGPIVVQKMSVELHSTDYLCVFWLKIDQTPKRSVKSVDWKNIWIETFGNGKLKCTILPLCTLPQICVFFCIVSQSYST